MGAVRAPTIRRSQSCKRLPLGLDIATSVFVRGIDAEGNLLVRRAQAPLRLGVLPETVAMPGWHRGLCYVASLVARTQALGKRALDAAAYVKVQPIPKNRIVSCWTTLLVGRRGDFFCSAAVATTSGCPIEAIATSPDNQAKPFMLAWR